MKLIDRYEFTNGKAFETRYLERADTDRLQLPECDVIGFYYGDDNDGHMRVMRPDEALIQARMLIDAVHAATSGYEVKLYESRDGERKEVFRAESKPLSMELVEDLEGKDVSGN